MNVSGPPAEYFGQPVNVFGVSVEFSTAWGRLVTFVAPCGPDPPYTVRVSEFWNSGSNTI